LHITENNITDFIRACYFSIVTMTTLGFGDMYANSASWLGHILLIGQVLIGYILLAALVTRFAVLFTTGGPAGEFSKTEKKNKHGQ
jgi:predicted permease